MTRGEKVCASIEEVYFACIFLLTFADRRPFLQAYCTLGFLPKTELGISAAQKTLSTAEETKKKINTVLGRSSWSKLLAS